MITIAERYAAWETLHYALREAMRGMTPEMLQRFTLAEGNMLVAEVAQETLDSLLADNGTHVS